MLKSDCLPFEKTGYFSSLICDYLDQKPELEAFYGNFPTVEFFKAQIEQKRDFSLETRTILTEALLNQYGAYNLSEEDSVYANIQQLKNSNTYTVTTGHQLNIFSGPLYFIYKIVSVINMAKKLNEAYPEQHFVPVYWMATEDHDFAEINHINHHGGRLAWNKEAPTGPVGRFDASGMTAVINELKQVLGTGKRAKHLVDLFTTAYLKKENVAEATRYFVHHWFGNQGLVIIDADAAELKTLAVPYFKKDLLENIAFKETQKASEYLKEHYTEQVHVREINLFYITDTIRERIEKQGDKWLVLNTEISFREGALLQELEKSPEKFSPNVVLRPLYQEVILPNLSYTGGGGELAYWLQLKSMFEAYQVPFPMLHLRNSVLWIPKRLQRKIEKLELQTIDLFKPLSELSKDYVLQNSALPERLNKEYATLETLFLRVKEIAKHTDKSMQTAVEAQYVKQTKGLDNLNKKLIRAEKRQSETAMRQLSEIKDGLFPGNSLQERHANFIAFYMEYGEDFIETLLATLNPFQYEFSVLRETT